MWSLPPVIQAGSEADQSSFSERKRESVDGDYPEVWGVSGMCRSVCGSHFQMCSSYWFLNCNTVPLIRNICTAVFYVNDLETKMILWERGGTSYVCLGIIIPFCQENVFFSLLAEGICAVSYLGKMSFFLFFFFKLILKRSTIVYLFFFTQRGLFIIHNLVLLSHCGCFFLSIWSFKTPCKHINIYVMIGIAPSFS